MLSLITWQARNLIYIKFKFFLSFFVVQFSVRINFFQLNKKFSFVFFCVLWQFVCVIILPIPYIYVCLINNNHRKNELDREINMVFRSKILKFFFFQIYFNDTRKWDGYKGIFWGSQKRNANRSAESWNE